MEDVGQEVGQGNDNDCLAEEGKEDGVVLLAQGFKGGLAAMLEDHENKGRKVEVEAGQGGLLQDRVGAEDAQQEHGKKAHDAPDDDAVAKAHDEHDLAGIEDIVHAAGAVVVAHDGRGALGDGQKGRLEHLAGGVDHGHGGDIDIAACVGEHVVAADRDDAVGELHDEGGHAQAHNLARAGAASADLVAAEHVQPVVDLFSEEKTQNKGGRQGLGEDRRDRGALHPHA